MVVDAVTNYKNYNVSVQQPVNIKKELKTEKNTSKISKVDKEKSNAAKWMIGATAFASVVCLGIAAYKGKFRRGVQNFSGGAEHNNTGIKIDFPRENKTTEEIAKIETFMEEHKEAVYEKLRDEGMNLLKKAKDEYNIDILKRAEKYANEYSDITKIEGEKIFADDIISNVVRVLEDGKTTVTYDSWSGKFIDVVTCDFPEGYTVTLTKGKNGAKTFEAIKKGSDIKRVYGHDNEISGVDYLNGGMSLRIKNGEKGFIEKKWKPTKVSKYNGIESYGHEIYMSNKKIRTKEEDVREYLGITL